MVLASSRYRSRGSVAALALAIMLVGCGKDDAPAQRKRPPQVVGAMPAAAQDYAPRLSVIGTVTPLQSVAVRPRSDGEITRIFFREGDFVRAGEPLFQLDSRAAAAQLGQARANLASARASAVQARSEYARAQQLVGKGYVSGAVLDQRKALAGSAEAAIAAAEAAVQSAETALSFQTIRAPVSGRTGEIGFRLGANVRAGEAVPLVTVNQLSPISVRFLVPPEKVPDVRSAMAAGSVTVAARAQGAAAGAPPLATGRLSFIDNNVNPGTGSVTAKADFVNAGDQLWPGAIVNIEMPLGAVTPRIALPEAAVQTGRDAPFVWAIGADNKVAMRDVAIAGRADGTVYLAGGVAPGEKIVIDALSRLKPGDVVRTRGGKPGGAGEAPRAVATTASGVGG